jgi:hypothetical protein
MFPAAIAARNSQVALDLHVDMVSRSWLSGLRAGHLMPLSLQLTRATRSDDFSVWMVRLSCRMLSFSLLVLTRVTTIADRNQAVGTTWHVLNEVQHENNNDYEDFLIPPDCVLVASAEQRCQPVLDLFGRHSHVYGRAYSHQSASAISENETATIRTDIVPAWCACFETS